MKYLRPILLLGMIAVVMLWLLGGKTHKWTVQLDTTAHPDRIFQEISDPERMKQWMSHVVQIEPQNELPLGVGFQYRIVSRDEKGASDVVEGEILEFDSERILKLHVVSRRYEGTSTYIIERKGQGYRLEQRLHTRYRGLYRLVTPFIGFAVQDQLDADFRALEQRLNESDVVTSATDSAIGLRQACHIPGPNGLLSPSTSHGCEA
jgi:uncharacterized protein YndB with AHSA1/START domain